MVEMLSTEVPPTVTTFTKRKIDTNNSLVKKSKIVHADAVQEHFAQLHLHHGCQTVEPSLPAVSELLFVMEEERVSIV